MLARGPKTMSFPSQQHFLLLCVFCFCVSFTFTTFCMYSSFLLRALSLGNDDGRRKMGRFWRFGRHGYGNVLFTYRHASVATQGSWMSAFDLKYFFLLFRLFSFLLLLFCHSACYLEQACCTIMVTATTQAVAETCWWPAHPHHEYDNINEQHWMLPHKQTRKISQPFIILYILFHQIQ